MTDTADTMNKDAALMARFERYFHNAITSLSPRERAKALSTPDDFSTVLEILRLASVKESPEMRVRIGGVIAKRKFLEQDGGVLYSSSVCELLGVSRQTVSRRRNAGKLLGVEVGHRFVYPVWQFQNCEVLPGFLEILKLLSDSTSWTQFIFFLSNNDACDGKRPIDLLRKRDMKAVRRAASMHGVHGAV